MSGPNDVPLTSLDSRTITHVHDTELPDDLPTLAFAFDAEDVADSLEVSIFAEVGYDAFERT